MGVGLGCTFFQGVCRGSLHRSIDRNLRHANDTAILIENTAMKTIPIRRDDYLDAILYRRKKTGTVKQFKIWIAFYTITSF